MDSNSSLIEKLNGQFQSESVSFDTGSGGMPKCIVHTPMAQAEIFVHGAHVTKFQPVDAEPVLWMSDISNFSSDKAIRGGIPICWPWFGPNGSDSSFPQHGFARTSEWTLRAVLDSDAELQLIFGLVHSPKTQSFLDAEFDARYRVIIGQGLTVEMSVTNTGQNPMTDIGCALHSYFDVSQIENASVTGLDGLEFLDQLKGNRKRQQGDVVFNEELDRVYFGTSNAIQLIDKGRNRSLNISSAGSQSTVVWNPWIAKSERMGDFPNEGYKTMVCIETANAFDDVRTIEPGDTHILSQTIQVIN